MIRTLRYLLVALALLLAQQAAQAHAFAHLGLDGSSTQSDSKGSGPSSGHTLAQCLLFHAIDCAPPPALLALDAVHSIAASPLHVSLPLPLPPRIVFDSRAPPARA